LHSPFPHHSLSHSQSASIFVSKSVVCTTDQFFDTEQLCTKPVGHLFFIVARPPGHCVRHDGQSDAPVCVYMGYAQDPHTHTARTSFNTQKERETQATHMLYVSLWFCSTRAYTLDSLVMSDFLESSSTHTRIQAPRFNSLSLSALERENRLSFGQEFLILC